MKSSKKILVCFTLLFLSLSVFANIFNDIKNEVTDFRNKRFGYGLGYRVLNVTPRPIVASSTIVQPSIVSSIDEAAAAAITVKEKRYTILAGLRHPHESSMYIKDKETGTTICKVNVSFTAELAVGDKKPRLYNLNSRIDQQSSLIYCLLADARVTTVKGYSVIAVTTAVMPYSAAPSQRILK